MIILFLQLGAERRRIKKEKIGDELCADTFDCSVCRDHPVYGTRYCWKNNNLQPVVLCGQPIGCLSKREFVVQLPLKNPMEFLAQRKATINGKMICPVPLVENMEALNLIQMETDMTHGEGGWGLMPLDKPSVDWPLALLNLLRQIRAEKATIQNKETQDMEKKAKTETVE